MNDFGSRVVEFALSISAIGEAELVTKNTQFAKTVFKNESSVHCNSSI